MPKRIRPIVDDRYDAEFRPVPAARVTTGPIDVLPKRGLRRIFLKKAGNR